MAPQGRGELQGRATILIDLTRFLRTSNHVIACWNKNMYYCCFKSGRRAPMTASPQVLWAELGLQELQELVASGRIF